VVGWLRRVVVVVVVVSGVGFVFIPECSWCLTSVHICLANDVVPEVRNVKRSIMKKTLLHSDASWLASATY
jgi:hypothetical protein